MLTSCFGSDAPASTELLGHLCGRLAVIPTSSLLFRMRDSAAEVDFELERRWLDVMPPMK